MTADLDQLMATMRLAGCRSSEERLRRTAIKRLATAQRHRDKAAAHRDTARGISDRFPESKRWFRADALRHEVRAAERGGQVTRPVRDVALRLVPSWAADVDELLLAAEAIALS